MASRLHTAYLVLKLIAVLAVMGLLVSLLMPVPAGGLVGYPEDAGRAALKFNKLAASNHRGVHGFQTFYEYELNAYLAAMVEGQQDPANPGYTRSAVRLETVNLNFTTGAVTAVITAHWGPVPLSLAMQGPLKLANSRLFMDVEQVRVGRFPVPPPFKRLLARRGGRIFQGLDREYSMAQRVLRFELAEDQVRVAVKPEEISNKEN